MKRQRGISLVELLLALTACSAILTLSAGLIVRIMRAEMRSRTQANCERTALRLASTFRGDVWAASEATISPVSPDSLVRLTLPAGRSVEYVRASSGTTRVLREGGRIVARDRFTFSEDTQVAVVQESLPMLRLQIDSAQAFEELAVPTWLQVRARLARNPTFVAAERRGEAVP